MNNMLVTSTIPPDLDFAIFRYFLLMHACFIFPGPPNPGLSLQNLHSPQSASRQFLCNPHRRLVGRDFTTPVETLVDSKTMCSVQ